jgi:hypothetical protein
MFTGPAKFRFSSRRAERNLQSSQIFYSLLATLFFCFLCGARDARAQVVDLALVLVIDNSGSIDPSESALQFNGYAEAFESAELVTEMTGGPNAAIAVSVLLFSDVVQSLGGWQIIDGPASASTFANVLRSAPYGGSGGTHIAQALEAAVMELASCPYPAVAATIDLSGDGPDNEGVAINIADPMQLLLAFTGLQTSQWNQDIQNNAYRLRRLRDSIKARGVSINCVAIQDPDLQDYFEKYVICGKGSFAMLASSFQSFRTVIKRKILREVQQGIRQGVQRSAKRPPKSPGKAKTTQPVGRAKKNESQDKKSELETEQDKNLAKQGSGGGDLQANSSTTSSQMVAAKSPEKVRTEIAITLRDTETKLPLSEANFSLIGEGANFGAEPNGSLPGQFVAEFDAFKGSKSSLRIEAPGYTPKEIAIDEREPARYEVELERLPIQFIL